MASSEQAPAKRVGVSLIEDSVVCETGGGFTSTQWQVAVNDGWMKLSQIVKRGTIDAISTELEDEDDPHRAVGKIWVDRPAQVYYRRRTYISAPIGTRLRKLIFTPVRGTDGVRFSRSESELVLAGDYRLMSRARFDEKAQRKARQAAQPRERLLTPVRTPDGVRASRSESASVRHGENRFMPRPFLDEKAEHIGRRPEPPREPLPKSDTLNHLGELLSRLGARPLSKANLVTENLSERPRTTAIPVAEHLGEGLPAKETPLTEHLVKAPPPDANSVAGHVGEGSSATAIQVTEAPSTIQTSSRRKEPVRETKLPGKSTPQGDKGSNSA